MIVNILDANISNLHSAVCRPTRIHVYDELPLKGLPGRKKSNWPLKKTWQVWDDRLWNKWTCAYNAHAALADDNLQIWKPGRINCLDASSLGDAQQICRN